MEPATATAAQTPPKNWGAAIPLVLAVIFYLGFVAFRWHERSTTTGAEHIAVGQVLPAIDLQPLLNAEGPVRESDLDGKVVLLNLWATWCGPCRVEYPRLVEIYERLAKEPDFRFLSVSCGSSGDTVEEIHKATARFQEDISPKLPTFVDLEGQTRRSVEAIVSQGGLALPTTILMDRSGTIRGVWEGFLPGDEVQMESMARELLAATPGVEK